MVEARVAFGKGKHSPKMKIAFVLPMWKIENPYPPLGLGYLAAVLEKAEHVVRIYDLSLDSLKAFSKTIQEIINFSPEVVGLSVMSHTYESALKIARVIKEKSEATVVFGGPHPSVMPKEVAGEDGVDIVVMGEAEETIREICGKRINLEMIDGICYSQEKKIFLNPKKNYIQDLDKLPFPGRHLLKLSRYSLRDESGNRMATIMTSRGCPYSCTYCYKGIFGRKFRERSTKSIVAEIQECMKKYNYRSFYFIDDLFTLNPRRVGEICSEIMRKKLNIRWQCLARVKDLTYEMLINMKKAGCSQVNLGIESGNQGILNKIKKGTTIQQAKTAVRCCKKVGIKTKGYFMFGLPGDTRETMEDTLNLARELELNDMMFSIATPFPGTELWQSINQNNVDLSKAFYYTDSKNLNILYNLSDATDYEIIAMHKKAQKLTNRVRKEIHQERFGKYLGIMAWQSSRVGFLKIIGKKILLMRSR